MLNAPFRTALVAVLALLATMLTGLSAAAADVQCPPNSTPIGGECFVTVTDPGSGGPITPVDNPGGGDTATCQFQGIEIPCHDAQYGYWNGSCYARVAEPQPPFEDLLWGGQTDGVIISCAMVSCVVPSIGVGPSCISMLQWSAAVPGGGPTPRQLAQQAVAAMQFRAPQIGTTGRSDDPDSMQIIGLPTWMWVADPDEHTTGPITRTATAGALSVTATGTLDRIVWDMGDGQSVTCAGAAAAGTPYEARYADQPSPTCGHRYQRTSARQPNQAYTITATSYWTVTWSGGGQSGTIPLTFSRSAQLRVGELQVIVTDGTGR